MAVYRGPAHLIDPIGDVIAEVSVVLETYPRTPGRLGLWKGTVGPSPVAEGDGNWIEAVAIRLGDGGGEGKIIVSNVLSTDGRGLVQTATFIGTGPAPIDDVPPETELEVLTDPSGAGGRADRT